jgi:alkanesulfonate monooxygenase SsuD/methylene tetrahydromethanopterin reductase-like flavin-dependent oxidoreductase (luciferase family)
MTQRLGVTMPVLQPPVDRATHYARMADEAGLHSAWDYEFYKNPFVMLAGAARATQRITLATGIAQAFTSTPFELANCAADIDELAGGRTILGLGAGARDFMAAFHADDFSAVVARMREYLAAVRRTWDYLHTGEIVPLQGRFYPLATLPMNPWGARDTVRPRIPIYLAAMRPKMIELAGEAAEGLLTYLQTPEFISESSRPRLAAGADRAERDVGEVDIASMVICSVCENREEARRRARLQVGMYVAYPIGDEVVRFHGFEREQAAIQQALMTKGLAALEDVTDDVLVDTFSICGTPEEARAQLSRYEAIPHLILHTPYIPALTIEETEDAYEGILDTFGDVAAGLGAKAGATGSLTS